MSNKNPQATYNQYKIRKVTIGNRSGEAYGITIPRNIAESFQGVKWSVSIMRGVDHTKIVFTSGLDIKQLPEMIQDMSLEELE